MSQLNRLIGDQSAGRDGVLMINSSGEVIVSRAGEWVPLQMAELSSPNGSKWRLSVSNTGTLTAVPA